MRSSESATTSVFSIRSPRHPILRAGLLCVVLLVMPVVAAAAVASSLPTPSEFLGFEVGADRKVADYRQVAAYLKALDERSPRIELVNLGKTTLGEELLMAVISSEENMKRLPRLREISRRLADPRGLSDAELEALVHEGTATVLVTCSIHASEVGASQMSMEWAHTLATADDPETRRRLQNVVLLLVPSLNPDGLNMEADWYRKNLDTKYEGGRMPWLYHHYVGHDNNRDWFMLTQKETKAMSKAVYIDWLPQLWIDEHQMGGTGPRIFVPPYSEPVDKDIHPLVWREVNMVGTHMALRLEQAKKAGVIYGFVFDAYWPGGTKNTAWFKNITGILTEVASVRFATPMYVDPSELSGGGKGLIDYDNQVNFPNPWKGGWWRLRDIMDYDRIISDAVLEICSDRKADIMRDMAARARASMAVGDPSEGYRIPALQRDPATACRLAELMMEHGVEVKRAANGDVWIPLAQPYGNFVQEMLETQRFNEVKLVPGPDIVEPYDVAAWSLPLMMGVSVERAKLPDGLVPCVPVAAAPLPEASSYALPASSPENAKAVNAALRSGGSVSMTTQEMERDGTRFQPGTIVMDVKAAEAAARSLAHGVTLAPLKKRLEPAKSLVAPRVGLYKPWIASMDEGWTRWLLEQYGFEPKSLDNKTIRAGKLRASYDVIILPDVEKEVIATGTRKREEGDMKYVIDLPPEYAGGLEEPGATALKEFVNAGGTIVALSASTDYVLDQFNIPVQNVLASAKPDSFSCPGSLLRASVLQGHPVTYGLPETAPLFLDASIAFRSVPPGSELSRWVLASYPQDERDVLMSGWIQGAEKATRRAAAVALTYGKGKLVLLGFRPQHRAQTNGTFLFLFNSIYWSVMDEPW